MIQQPCTHQKGTRWSPVSLTDQLGGLSSISRLQLSSRHDDWANAQLLVSQCALEGLTLTLASPDTQDKRHLDLR